MLSDILAVLTTALDFLRDAVTNVYAWLAAYPVEVTGLLILTVALILLTPSPDDDPATNI